MDAKLDALMQMMQILNQKVDEVVDRVDRIETLEENSQPVPTENHNNQQMALPSLSGINNNRPVVQSEDERSVCTTRTGQTVSSMSASLITRISNSSNFKPTHWLTLEAKKAILKKCVDNPKKVKDFVLSDFTNLGRKREADVNKILQHYEINVWEEVKYIDEDLKLKPHRVYTHKIKGGIKDVSDICIT
jgi:hypothetical protein